MLKNNYIKSLFVIYLVLLSFYANARTLQDSIPPIFTTFPQDTTVFCGQDNLSAISQWYQRQAGAVADFGEAEVFASISLDSASSAIQQLLEAECNDNYVLSIEFFAIDSCGNRSSETLSSNFIIEDNRKPEIIIPASNVSVYCSEGIQDSLLNWLQSQGSAMASDDCSSLTTWTNYIWNDNSNNSGFGTFSNLSPIPIQREICNWEVTVSFFVEDACGNDNVTTGTFQIIGDTISPIIISTIPDTTIQCSEDLPNRIPIMMDGCDGELTLNSRDSIIRALDPFDCGFYNYQLIKIWTGTDACGNTTETRTIFNIEDSTAPIIELNDAAVAIDCDLDLNDPNNFLSVEEACSEAIITFRDSVLLSNTCQTQINRQWYATDYCDNQDSSAQLIQIQDFKGPEFLKIPEDLSINCSSSGITESFEEWISTISPSDISDPCNAFLYKVLPANNYLDTLSFSNLSTPDLKDLGCRATDSIGFLLNQSISFVAYDICGNITNHIATFSIVDTESPTIISCPTGFDIQITDLSCETEYSLSLPAYTDNCADSESVQWEVALNEEILNEDIIEGRNIKLPVGSNKILYTVKDCGSNQDTCTQLINVIDGATPELICPENKTLYVEENNCEIESSIDPILNYSDNCMGNEGYSQTLPNNNGFIQFSFNSFGNIYQASDKIIEFLNPIDNEVIFNPTLVIEYKINLQQGSNVIIRDEDSNTVFVLSNGDCEAHTASQTLDLDKLKNWFSDGVTKFDVINQANNNFGTVACKPENIQGQQGIDQESYLRLTLSYSSVEVSNKIKDLSSNDETLLTSPFIVAPGEYEIIYEAQDLAGNLGECSSTLSVLDTFPPSVICDSISYQIDPNLQGFFPLVLADLNFQSTDNCMVTQTNFSPRQLECSQINTELFYSVNVLDNSGNPASCSAKINLSTSALNPSFVSGLCLADTLKLFANIEESQGFDINWEGPNNFNSNNLNPIISNISDLSSGTYILSAISLDGCEFIGNLEIDVNEFDSPLIFTNQLEFCVGDEVLLNTNSFTEQVEYFWYEGISPNGTLIGQTSGPSFAISPLEGNHFYYVEVNGDNCNSNPSNTLEINVKALPIAEIANPFITICEGEDITLNSSVFDPAFSFEWRGPNNYFSEGQFPEIIREASIINQGNYTLIIKDGECISDTALAQVIIFESPPTPIISGDNILCEGQSAVLTVSNLPNATRYMWFLNGTFYNSVSSNSLLIPAISGNESGEWTVVVEQGICTSEASLPFTVAVENTLNIGATNDGPFCEGDSVTLLCSFIPNATYTWEDPNGINYDGRTVVAPAVSGTYSVTVTTPTNCQATTTTNVEVGLRPTITALSNNSLPCMANGNTITFFPTVFPEGIYEYIWEGPAGFSAQTENPTLTVNNENINGTYTLSVINDNCESEEQSTLVDLTINPDQAQIELTGTPCTGSNLKILILNPSNNTETLWLWQTPKGQLQTDLPELCIDDFELEDVGNYSVIQSLNDCRSVPSINLSIQNTNELSTPIIIGNNQLCEGEIISLKISEENAENYIWFTPQGTTSTSSNELLIENITIDNEGAYSVYFTSGSCLSDTSAIFNVQISAQPNPPLFTDDEITLCASELSNLEICTNNTNQDFDLINLYNLEEEILIQTSQTACLDLSSLLENPSNTYTLGLTSSLKNCESDLIDTLILTLSNIGSSMGAQINQDTILICDESFTSLNVDLLPQQVNTSWRSINPDINIFEQENGAASFSNLNPGANTLIVSSSIGACDNFIEDTVSLFVLNEIIANNDTYNIDFNTSAELDPLLNDNYSSAVEIKILDSSDEFQYSINNDKVTFANNSSFIGEQIVTYEICYLDCPSLCDQATINLTIGINTDCFVSNLLTPNNDGFNDIFLVPCLNASNYENNSLIIFNQWGDEIFDASPYNNDWQGTHEGKILPSGTYFYILDLGDGSKPLQGFITLE